MNFALYFGNRGFFPGHLISKAREDLTRAVAKLGHKVIMMDGSETKFGAVETTAEGAKYAAFLKRNEGSYDGVILSLPNFGDENGAAAALKDCGTPIFIQAYPDSIGLMDPANRRDAFCGKISVMDVFNQYKIPFTVFPPHTVHPDSSVFEKQLANFSSVCSIVKGMKKVTVGAIGARTTVFKTIRFDETTLQKYGITTETLDLSEVFMRYKDMAAYGDRFDEKKRILSQYTSWDCVPVSKLENITKLGLVLDDIIEEYKMDSIALRCWIELEKEIGVAPCVLMGELNDRGITAACELDVCNAIGMRVLSLASGKAAACLDWNNNYGDDEDKCVLFHCGPVPQSLMAQKGQIVDHPMFAKSFGAGCGWGCNAGRIAASPFTYASSKTEDGKLVFYVGEGKITEDEIEQEYFGCAGVAEINDLQKKLLSIGRKGFRHHVGITFGNEEISIKEALETYLKYDMTEL
jgi:L-fucose isomerase-like protein